MYKYSMTQWIFGNENLENSFKRLVKYGYDGIEYAGDPYNLDTEYCNTLMRNYNIYCTSLCGIFTEDRDLTSNDSKISENAIKYLKDCVDFALGVKAPYIIVVPSPVGRTALPQGRTYDEMWLNAIKNIREAADYANEKGVRFCIEAINRYETYFVNNLTKAFEFVEEISHPAVGIMADMFHMSIEENNTGKSLRLIADKLMHVHIADNTREAAGLGNTDFKDMLYILNDIKYKGPLTMEFMPRLANPYASGNMETQNKLMDKYAQQAIRYMKQMENCLI